jgi:hypothetical protein
MKRFTRALVVTMVAMFTLAAVTLATHSVSANFNPDPPVVGQNLTVTVTTDEPDYGNHLILEACRAFNMGDGETPTGAWSPASVCATIDGKWVELGKADRPRLTRPSSPLRAATRVLAARASRTPSARSRRAARLRPRWKRWPRSSTAIFRKIDPPAILTRDSPLLSEGAFASLTRCGDHFVPNVWGWWATLDSNQ